VSGAPKKAGGKGPGNGAGKPMSSGPPPREVRIIGGVWKRSKLPVLNHPGLRPSPDRVRETLFNWLGQDLSGWRCLDAFAGTGALGFEAASRGAASVQLVEREPRLARCLQESVDRLKAASTVQVAKADAFSWMARSAPQAWELVFLDPPFADQLFEKAVMTAVRLVVPDGFIYLEADRDIEAAALAEIGLTVTRHSKAGAVHFFLLQRSAVTPSVVPSADAPDATEAPEAAD
jgi:16S rRNA (guanine(966)-N(2))-methyltransferase RsmD